MVDLTEPLLAGASGATGVLVTLAVLKVKLELFERRQAENEKKIERQFDHYDDELHGIKARERVREREFGELKSDVQHNARDLDELKRK